VSIANEIYKRLFDVISDQSATPSTKTSIVLGAAMALVAEDLSAAAQGIMSAKKTTKAERTIAGALEARADYWRQYADYAQKGGVRREVVMEAPRVITPTIEVVRG
jgi:hypothetical protein